MALELSFVIPVFNAGRTIGKVVDEIHAACTAISYEIVLVNDGSGDDTESECRRLAAENSSVVLVQLARNFGELAAVMAGLHHATGSYVVIMDDDGQHPPHEALRLYDAIRARGDDVIFGRYESKAHTADRNFASWLYNAVATILIGKPWDLYLSSFKIMSRFVVDAIEGYDNAPPYIDGLILRTTNRISQLDVEHRPRLDGESNYTIGRLAYAWIGMLLGFSALPLRMAGLLGLACSTLSAPMLVFFIVDKLWITPNMTFGIPTVLCLMMFFSGIQLLILGIFGEYLGRIYVARAGSPRFVVRYCERRTEPR